MPNHIPLEDYSKEAKSPVFRLVAKPTFAPLEFAFTEGFRRHEANDILHITEKHRYEFLRAWYKAFGNLSHE